MEIKLRFVRITDDLVEVFATPPCGLPQTSVAHIYECQSSNPLITVEMLGMNLTARIIKEFHLWHNEVKHDWRYDEKLRTWVIGEPHNGCGVYEQNGKWFVNVSYFCEGAFQDNLPTKKDAMQTAETLWENFLCRSK